MSERPLVAVLCTAPIVCEALTSSLKGIADVRAFPAGAGDTEGLLRALRPDAVVVDREREADAAASVARDSNIPVVLVSHHDQALRVLRGGSWIATGESASAEAIRNAVVGSLFRSKVTA